MAGISQIVHSEQGFVINDARRIDRQFLSDYATYVRGQLERGELAVSTTRNRISSENRTMATLRGDQYVKVLRWVNSAAAFGNRCRRIKTESR